MFKHWTGETAQSTDAPKTFCNSGETGWLCGSSTCFSCDSIREMQAQKVRGTLLASFLESYFLGVGYYYINKTRSVHSLIKFKQIPCRTAMRGSFPLNGTYFQVNEVNIRFHMFFFVLFFCNCSRRTNSLPIRFISVWMSLCRYLLIITQAKIQLMFHEVGYGTSQDELFTLEPQFLQYLEVLLLMITKSLDLTYFIFSQKFVPYCWLWDSVALNHTT